MATHAAAASLRLEAVASSSSPHGTSSQNDGEFIAFKASMRLPIAPVFASRGDNMFPGHDGGMDGVREVLAGWVMRYLPPLRAVLLSFSPTPRFLHPAQRFRANRVPFDSMYESGDESQDDDHDDANAEAAAGGGGGKRTVRLKSLPMVDGSGFTLANVEWEGVGWRPRVGMKLVGTLTLASASHVSLLLHNLFNASIPVSHIPIETYEWDPEFPVPPVVLERRNANLPLKQAVSEVVQKANEAAEEAAEQEAGEDEGVKEEDESPLAKQEEEEDEAAEFAERGWWVHRKSREPLGGQDGRLEFTLVGLTTSNSLLSCTGSLLSDPFSASAIASLQSSLHTPLSASSTLLRSKLSTKGKKRARDEDEIEEVLEGEESSDSDDSDDDEGLDADDDDRVGTGIPRGHGAQAVPRFNEDDSASESSRSPSPEPVPPPVKKSKKVKVAQKEEEEVKEVKPKKEKSSKKKAKA
ncbi:hypothetical protein JCM10908_002921 [Rhodotorula pacifica]|uniref:uncharacterized protein n=1 Tax=Rhodotorula pacifica TaxID=1495444 RepID=UPI00316E7000